VDFWKRVNKHGPVAKFNNTRCWLWLGCKNEKGYGLIHHDGAMRRAHRVAWFLKHRRWPKDKACHRCDVRNCVRTSHLFEGSQSDNLKDMARKGRSTHGERHPMVKLTKEKVARIRRLVQAGYCQKDLALRFNIHYVHLNRIVKGHRWRRI